MKGGSPPNESMLNKNMYLWLGGSAHKDISFIFLRGDIQIIKIILADRRQ